jgi:hypothetical protein
MMSSEYERPYTLSELYKRMQEHGEQLRAVMNLAQECSFQLNPGMLSELTDITFDNGESGLIPTMKAELFRQSATLDTLRSIVEAIRDSIEAPEEAPRRKETSLCNNHS